MKNLLFLSALLFSVTSYGNPFDYFAGSNMVVDPVGINPFSQFAGNYEVTIQSQASYGEWGCGSVSSGGRFSVSNLPTPLLQLSKPAEMGFRFSTDSYYRSKWDYSRASGVQGDALLEIAYGSVTTYVTVEISQRSKSTYTLYYSNKNANRGCEIVYRLVRE
jgi:hypothetical protein